MMQTEAHKLALNYDSEEHEYLVPQKKIRDDMTLK